MKNKKILLAIGSLLVIILLWFFFHKNNDTMPAITTVSTGDITEKVTAVGTIDPAQSFTVKSAISGTVAALFHDEGDLVKQGDKLLQIKPNPTPDDYATTKQQVDIDRAKEQQYQADVKRYQDLLKQGAISPHDQDLSTAISNYKQAQLQRTLDDEKLALIDQGQAVIAGRVIANVITSPATGYILQRNVNLSDPVVAQTTAQAGSDLFVIADMNSLIFKGQVSETDVAKLKTNMPATIKVGALPDASVKGMLSKIALESTVADASNSDGSPQSSSSATSGSSSPFNVGFRIEIDHLAPPKNMQLRAGFSATADIVIKEVKHVLVVPTRVLQFDDGKPFVWLVDKNKQAQKQSVTTGVTDGMQIQIVSGLKKGDQIFESKPGEEQTSTDTDQ